MIAVDDSQHSLISLQIFTEQFWPLLQVILVDLVLAGDNAIIIALVAASVPTPIRQRVIWIGIAGAALMRIAFALVTVQLLEITGLLLAGGLLLLWVCWKLWRELAKYKLAEAHRDHQADTADKPKTTANAIFHIILADVSMSLDNVLAVAGVARGDSLILIIGLALSVALMAFAATLVARLLEKHRWIAYAGLAIILYVALSMIWSGTLEVMEFLTK